MTGNLRLKACVKSTQPFTPYEPRGTIRVLKKAQFHDPSAIAPFQTGSLLSFARATEPLGLLSKELPSHWKIVTEANIPAAIKPLPNQCVRQ